MKFIIAKNVFAKPFIATLILCCTFFSCKPTPKDLTILYGASLEEVQKRL